MDDAENPADAGLAGLILAAGAASRFGGIKQLAQLDGQALVVRAVRALAPSCDGGVLVITGAYQEDVAAALVHEPARCIYNPGWRAGMGSSIGAGLDQLGPSISGVIIALADQPGVEAADFQALAQAWRQQSDQPAAAVYAGSPGVPAVFPRAWWAALQQLQGDRGARSLLREASRLTTIDLPGAAWDVDEPGDLPVNS